MVDVDADLAMLLLDVTDVVDGVSLAADVDVALLVLEDGLVVAVGFDVAVLTLDAELVVVALLLVLEDVLVVVVVFDVVHTIFHNFKGLLVSVL